ncbi:MAG: right-handed parallel beta-helix repeat-containing protein [Bacteroidota bacterium]|nr:right-handed parallel beta-helix repeat-containing protein [Bacteroidota bacterium]
MVKRRRFSAWKLGRLSAAVIILLAFRMDAAWRILPVGPGLKYERVRTAAAEAAPGDTILVTPGRYAGGEYIDRLQGTEGAWVTIMAEQTGTVVFEGGTEAIHLSDPAWIRISGFVFEGQSGNGVNIDDGGTFDTPARHILVENCIWRALNASGNNDQLKLSGVDSFLVRGCRFENGSPGGSCVDMVGCHWGAFEENIFVDAGSNCIQAKGGTAFIRIERNRFIRGGQRALNIGGSTGLEYFRPQDAPYESFRVGVYSNVFIGATAPIAFVGAVECEVVNNTIYRPDKWAIRILQETVAPRFLPCGDNAFRNNIVVVGSAASNPSINIGSNTAPGTFEFTANLWYNEENPAWGGPNLPVVETDGIIGSDPLFTDATAWDFTLRPHSPAAGAGVDVAYPERDHAGRRFARPRSIGAFEANSPTSIECRAVVEPGLRAFLFPNPSHGQWTAEISLEEPAHMVIIVCDMLGHPIATAFDGALQAGRSRFVFPGKAGAAAFPPGIYWCRIHAGARTLNIPIVVN